MEDIKHKYKYDQEHLTDVQFLGVIEDVKTACRILNQTKKINIRYVNAEEQNKGGKYWIYIDFESYFTNGTTKAWQIKVNEIWLMARPGQAEGDGTLKGSNGVTSSMNENKAQILRLARRIFDDYNYFGRQNKWQS